MGGNDECPFVQWPFVRVAFCPVAFYRWPFVRWPFVHVAFCPGAGELTALHEPLAVFEGAYFKGERRGRAKKCEG